MRGSISWTFEGLVGRKGIDIGVNNSHEPHQVWQMAHGRVAVSASDAVLAFKEEKDGFGVVLRDTQVGNHMREHFAAQSALGGALEDCFAG